MTDVIGVVVLIVLGSLGFSGGLFWITLILWVLFICYLMINFFLHSWMPILFRDEGLSVHATAVTTAMFDVGGIFGALIISRMIDKRGVAAIAVLYLVLLGIVVYAFVMGFYAVSTSWAAPVILSAADEKSLDFREKLVTSQQTIEDLKVDSKKLESGLDEMNKHRAALLALEPQLQSAIARELAAMGYRLIATRGTARVLRSAGIDVEETPKLQEGRPNLIDHMKNGQVALGINTPSGKGARTDEGRIRAAAVMHRVTCITTLAAAQAAVAACRALRQGELTVKPLQDWFADQANTSP